MSARAQMKSLGSKLVFIAVVLMLCTACGRKAPPVPPSFMGLTPPSSVSASMDAGKLVVTWADPPASERRDVAGYRIDISRLPEGEERCDGCPVRFEPAGTAQGYERRFALSVSSGVLYTIEVRATAEGGYVSNPSLRVEVDFRSQKQ